MRLVLASNSASRKRILADAGFRFLVCPSNVDERSPKENPMEWAQDVAVQKAIAVAGTKRYAKDVIVAADTSVVLRGERLGKPQDMADAYRMLKALSGLGHQVITGLAVRYRENVLTNATRADITFRDLEASDIEKYLATGDWQGRAGAYAGQGKGALLIDHIDGDYLAMAGLPLRAFYTLLHEQEIDPYQFMR